MSRADSVQFNVRSTFARQRAHELARMTGMTATQVVEEALRGYVPPGSSAGAGNLVRCGPILVKPGTGFPISAEDAEAALMETRERDED